MSIYIALSRLHMSMKLKGKLLNIWLELYFKKSVVVQVRKSENVSPLLLPLLYLTAAYSQKLWLSWNLRGHLKIQLMWKEWLQGCKSQPRMRVSMAQHLHMLVAVTCACATEIKWATEEKGTTVQLQTCSKHRADTNSKTILLWISKSKVLTISFLCIYCKVRVYIIQDFICQCHVFHIRSYVGLMFMKSLLGSTYTGTGWKKRQILNTYHNI